jgi:hypothetical protein
MIGVINGKIKRNAMTYEPKKPEVPELKNIRSTTSNPYDASGRPDLKMKIHNKPTRPVQ